MKLSGVYSAPLLLTHLSYDETPLRVRVQWSGEPMQSELAKTFCVKMEWMVLLRRHGQDSGAPEAEHLMLRGAMAPIIRFSDSASGESVAGILQATTSPPEWLHSAQVFERSVRISALANERGERLLAPTLPGWTKCYLRCGAHRIHASAEKTWELASTLSGLTRTLLIATHAQQLAALQDSLMTFLSVRLHVCVGAPQLSLDALQYRRNLLRAFMPGPGPGLRRPQA